MKRSTQGDHRQSLVESAFAQDFLLSLDSQRTLPDGQLTRLSQFLASTSFPLVYTAFDGDHFAMTPLMRSYCLSRQHVPANPESILGYKDTVDRHLSKAGVLRDDLAVLRSCNELWVFTDEQPCIESLARLAEGVLIEILYFVLSRGTATVAFVEIGELLLGRDPDPVAIEITADVLGRVLPKQLWADLLGFLGGRSLGVKAQLPKVAFVAMDPLDSKYMAWLRPHALRQDQVVIVPGLAVELGDVVLRQGEMGCLLVSWVNLMTLADEIWVLPPLDAKRPRSNTVNLLVAAWESRRGSGAVSDIEWSAVGVPKALQGRAWPLTKQEGGLGVN